VPQPSKQSGPFALRVAARLILLLPLILLGSTRAAAQGQYEPDISQADLETLLNTPTEVVTATRTAQSSYEAPAIITTITREQIAVWGYRTIAELLNHLLGFYVVDDHTAANVAVRGSSGGLYSDSSIIKVLINGHAVPFASTGGNALGPELIPLSAVERVEVIRGPASALYGADAFLGVVNIQTRDGASLNGGSGWAAVGRVGKHFASDTDVSLGVSRGMADLMIAFRHTKQDLSGLQLPESSPAPNIPDYNAGSRTAHGLDQASDSGIARLTLQPREGTEISVLAYGTRMERGSEFGSLFQLANGFNEAGVFSENRVTQWQFRGGLDWTQAIGSKLTLALRADYFQGAPGKNNRLEVGSEFYYVRRDFGFRGTNVETDLVWSPTEALRVVTGASLLVDRERLPSRIGVAKQLIEGVPPGGTIDSISVYGGRKTFVNLGAYLQGTYHAFGDYLGLTGGLRYDQHNIYGAQLSRRVGLVSSLRPNLHAKLLHGSAFKAPSPLLLYAVPSASGDVIGNQDLKPQYVNTFEFQLAWQPADWLNLSSDLAYNRLSNKTEFIQQGINKVARNVARATTLSFENLLELRYPQWLHAHVSVEMQHTTQQTGQDGYVGSVMSAVGSSYPDHMIHSGVVVQPPGFPVRAAVLYSYIGQRWATGNNILLNGGPYQLPAYTLLDAKISTVGFRWLRDPAQEISFSVSGKNLGNRTGPAPGFSGVDYPLSPRAFFFQLNLSL
jgi:outer membrane receptor for ferrienterochelin and colicins